MTAAIVEKPALLPIQFVRADQQDNANYDQKPMLDDWYINQIRYWQQTQQYAQPIQFNQRVRLMFGINRATGCTLKLIDCNGHTYATWNASKILDIPKNIEPYTGANEQLYVYYFKPILANISPALAEGTYYWLLTVPDDTTVSGNHIEISEPCYLKAHHANTILFNVTNYTNDYNFFPEQTNCHFYMRLEGSIDNYDPESDDVTYKDQKNNTTKLYGQTGGKFTLTTGLLPDYMIYKLNAYMVMDYIKINKGIYVKSTGAKWDITRTAGAPLSGAAIDIEYADQELQTFTLTSGIFDMYRTLPAYPYFITDARIGLNVASILYESGGRYIPDSTAEAQMITDWNASADDYDLFGTFQITGRTLQYVNGEDEFYNAAAITILTSYITLTVAKTASSVMSFDIISGAIGVSWGDNAVSVASGGITGPTTVSHTFGSSATFTVRVFGSYLQFAITEAGLSAIATKWPAGLKSLSIQGTGITTGLATFDGSTLSNCVNTIETLSFSNCQLATVTNMPYSSFLALRYMFFILSKLSSAQVSSMVIGTRNRMLTHPFYNGYLYVYGQTPAAPLTSAGATNKATLINTYQWLVSND